MKEILKAYVFFGFEKIGDGIIEKALKWTFGGDGEGRDKREDYVGERRIGSEVGVVFLMYRGRVLG